MSRKLARECTYKLVFEFLFNKTVNKRTYEIFESSDLDEGDIAYMQKAYMGVVTKYPELIDTIAKFAEGFSVERIYRTDLAALLLAIYEMKYMPDIPLSVSIAEAVEIVKKYSTEKSNQFVNGILSSVYKQLNSQAQSETDG
ncbi:MAG TPA: transcription antitermination factor NusB [Clostridia bacterium]|jgi:N utilization substance protein B|nr:transcription antitermination factor NusB [Clostridia bacterium]